MVREFSPAEIERVSGLIPDVLRDWRRRRLLENVGSLGSNGRWTYLKGDLVLLAVTAEIVRLDVSIALALEIASQSTAAVHAWLVKNPTDLHLHYRAMRYLVASNWTGSPQVEFVTDFDAIGRLSSSVCIFLDCRQIAEKLRPAFDAEFPNLFEGGDAEVAK